MAARNVSRSLLSLEKNLVLRAPFDSENSFALIDFSQKQSHVRVCIDCCDDLGIKEAHVVKYLRDYEQTVCSRSASSSSSSLRPMPGAEKSINETACKRNEMRKSVVEKLDCVEDIVGLKAKKEAAAALVETREHVKKTMNALFGNNMDTGNVFSVSDNAHTIIEALKKTGNNRSVLKGVWCCLCDAYCIDYKIDN